MRILATLATLLLVAACGEAEPTVEWSAPETVWQDSSAAAYGAPITVTDGVPTVLLTSANPSEAGPLVARQASFVTRRGSEWIRSNPIPGPHPSGSAAISASGPSVVALWDVGEYEPGRGTSLDALRSVARRLDEASGENLDVVDVWQSSGDPIALRSQTSLAGDVNGEVHAVVEIEAQQAPQIAYLRRSPNGVWSDPEVIAIGEMARLDGSGPLLIVTYQTIDPQTAEKAVMLMESTDSGRTWFESTVAQIPSDTDFKRAQAARSADGTTHILWREGEAAFAGNLGYASRFPGGEWSDPERYAHNETGVITRARLLVDSRGRAHAIYYYQDVAPSGNGTLYHTVREDGTWSRPQALTQEGDVFPADEVPQIARDDGVLHMTWIGGSLSSPPKAQYSQVDEAWLARQ